MREAFEGFAYRNGELYCDDAPVAEICERYGTPLYIYSHAALTGRFQRLREAFSGVDATICYSVKSNSNIAVIRALAQEGAGADIVSVGELRRALSAGVDPQKIVFAGVGKTEAEIAEALDISILAFAVESAPEAYAVGRAAEKAGKRAPITLRINPDVDAKTHRHTTTGKKGVKFGVDIDAAPRLFKELENHAHLDVCGAHIHLGSPVTTIEAYESAMDKAVALIAKLRKNGSRSLRLLNMGGGLPIVYKDETELDLNEYARVMMDGAAKAECRLALEPGRYISGNSGILCARVLYRKETGHKTFIIIDGAMNDLIRPSFYGSWHEIRPVELRGREIETVDVVGPICESGDFLAKERSLPRMEAGETLAVFSAGAYGFVMSSNYNSRPRAAEAMTIGGEGLLIRERETLDDLTRGERIPEILRDGKES